MWQTIVVFILFFGIIAYQLYKFFTKEKSSGDCGCSGCDTVKKTSSSKK